MNIEKNNHKLRELGLPSISSTKFKTPEDPRYVIHLYNLHEFVVFFAQTLHNFVTLYSHIVFCALNLKNQKENRET